MIRSLSWAGRGIRLLGVEGYNSVKGADVIYQELRAMPPGRVLMESFAAADQVVAPGDVLPYRSMLNERGLGLAMGELGGAKFRERLSAEAVAVLTALQVGSEVAFGDRLHATSFNRIVATRSLNDLRYELIDAVEMVGTKLEEPLAPAAMDDLPQNFICPMFKELGEERHMVMAQLVRQCAEQGHDVCLVVGKEHIDPVAKYLEEPAYSGIEGLLDNLDDGSGASSSPEAFAEELEKRVALAAFVLTTKTFPADLVLPQFEDLVPDAQAVVKKIWPKYRNAFRNRLANHLEGAGSKENAIAKAMAQKRILGVLGLEELCQTLDNEQNFGGADFPDTPPPPPTG